MDGGQSEMPNLIEFEYTHTLVYTELVSYLVSEEARLEPQHGQ